MRRFAPVAIIVMIAGCTAINQQKALPAKSDNLQFHNLQVLSPNQTRDELISTMRGFARALGTRCEHCHVQTATEPRPEFDFPSDAKPEKKVARTMIRMVRSINGDFISKLPKDDAEGPQKVTCATCHRGHVQPEKWAPPAPEHRDTPPPQP
jgi:photosynthetic reaction center cytochrome c subunit